MFKSHKYNNNLIDVEEIYGFLERGVTRPLRCRLQDGRIAIVKYMRNPLGQRVLINELVGSCIADIIGLSIPSFGICELSNDVIYNSNDEEEIDELNAGPAFYTEFYSQSVPPNLKSFLSLVINKETERIILFDHIVNNNDRHEGNLLLVMNHTVRMVAIDNSNIITDYSNKDFKAELNSSVIESDKLMSQNRDIYNLLIANVGFNENVLREEARNIQSIVTEGVLRDIRNIIPVEWTNNVDAGYVDCVFSVIKARVKALVEIEEIVIESRRKLNG